MNKNFNILARTGTKPEDLHGKPTGKGKTFDWCKTECEKVGLELVLYLGYYQIYSNGVVIGQFDTITEVRKCILNGDIGKKE